MKLKNCIIGCGSYAEINLHRKPNKNHKKAAVAAASAVAVTSMHAYETARCSVGKLKCRGAREKRASEQHRRCKKRPSTKQHERIDRRMHTQQPPTIVALSGLVKHGNVVIMIIRRQQQQQLRTQKNARRNIKLACFKGE